MASCSQRVSVSLRGRLLAWLIVVVWIIHAAIIAGVAPGPLRYVNQSAPNGPRLSSGERSCAGASRPEHEVAHGADRCTGF